MYSQIHLGTRPLSPIGGRPAGPSLRRAVSYHIILYDNSRLVYSMLYYTILCYVTLEHIIIYYTTLHCII